MLLTYVLYSRVSYQSHKRLSAGFWSSAFHVVVVLVIFQHHQSNERCNDNMIPPIISPLALITGLLLPSLVASFFLNRHPFQRKHNSPFAGQPKICAGTPRSCHERRFDAQLQMSSINFKGDALSELLVTLPPNVSPSRTLPEWLRHAESDVNLLGTNKIYQRSDGSWDCQQPPINWFGSELVSTFVNRIDRSENIEQVSVSIIDTRTEIVSGGGRAGDLIVRVMERSSFSGGTVLSWKQVNDCSWILSANLALTLTVELPRFVPLPLGFNTIGSRIVSGTCRARIVQNLEDLKEAYWQWASRP